MTGTGGFFKPGSYEDTEAFIRRVREALGIGPSSQGDEASDEADLDHTTN